MAKGQVSDDELQSSLRAVGSLGGIVSSGARRDSPFGADVVRKPQSLATPIVESPVMAAAASNEEFPQTNPLKPETIPLPPPTVKPLKRRSRGLETTDGEDDDSSPRVLSEKVTLQMSAAMRDDLNYLATKLQRRKTNKKQRITTNTVMRVAIHILLDELKLRDTDVANTEEELLDLIKRKILRDGRS